MVAYVYRTNRNLWPHPEEVLKLSGGKGCEVSEYHTTGGEYSSEIAIGNDENYILLKGCVVHDLVRNVMKGETLRTQKVMLNYLTRLINGEED
jgi:hypothetical protein